MDACLTGSSNAQMVELRGLEPLTPSRTVASVAVLRCCTARGPVSSTPHIGWRSAVIELPSTYSNVPLDTATVRQCLSATGSSNT
jgi:hypothetical protein